MNKAKYKKNLSPKSSVNFMLSSCSEIQHREKFSNTKKVPQQKIILQHEMYLLVLPFFLDTTKNLPSRAK